MPVFTATRMYLTTTDVAPYIIARPDNDLDPRAPSVMIPANALSDAALLSLPRFQTVLKRFPLRLTRAPIMVLLWQKHEFVRVWRGQP
ncbi:hypothetical protein FB451DRAFT_1394007 [Mycena latifolia]|nr:hypothetical protein FB451DRAFT_1394007 [Mycena latifolia]